jgi:hypothetical protein
MREELMLARPRKRVRAGSWWGPRWSNASSGGKDAGKIGVQSVARLITSYKRWRGGPTHGAGEPLCCPGARLRPDAPSS